tara:strand:+ start:576 stop:1259 length:684 start_codon:yes stop_codon:yes gene_type:complete
MKNPIFCIKRLSFFHKENKILNINKFELHRGAVYLFSGFMGSGKSTLMKILANEKKVNAGSVFYEDTDITQIGSSKYAKEVIFLGQNDKRPWLGNTVKAYMIKQIKSKLGSNYEKILKKICNSMKISAHLLNSDVRLISEGEFRWVKLSISIALDSKVLIVDYLDKSLDSNRRIILNRVLKRKASHDGVTIIASSYNPDFFKMSTSVFIKLDKGRITQVRSLSHKSK